MNISRRHALMMGAAATVAIGLPGIARADVVVDQLKLMAPAGDLADHVYGKKDAKVTVIEYLSPTCPHCARFQAEVYPELKTKYIDTQKIAYIPRPFMRNILDAAVFMLAEAAGADQYENVLTTYFKTQDQWVTSNAPHDALQQIALQLGFTKDSFDKALTNQTVFNGLEKVRDQALNDFQVNATPTFFVNGKQLVGEQTLEQLSAAIDPLLG